MDLATSTIQEYKSLPDFWWLILLGTFSISFTIQKIRSKNSLSNCTRLINSLLMTYCMFIILETLMNRNSVSGGYALMPFWSYIAACNGNPTLWNEIILNYLLFMPFGILMFLATGKLKKSVVCGFIFSCIVEILQLILSIGLFEFDDIIGNTFGSLIGSLIGKELKYI